MDHSEPPEISGTSVQATQPRRVGFGAFKGVYTPSILTILGVIMYLRVGWVLGNAGLWETLLIVTISSGITFLTGLSISAIATNMKVGGGGAYYMISRSLGLEPGAAIGLPLFLAQALVVSFYIAGFSESISTLFPVLAPKLVGVAALATLTALAYFSADLALKAQFFILTIIGISLVSFFSGGPPADGFPEVLAVPDKVSFWVAFAVFFPAVTGIEAGIAMSGNLKEPARALPRGTIGAVLTGYAVYLAIPIFLAAHVPEQVLLTDNLIMRKIAWWGDAILLGVWGATLSSALASLLGAPRTLQALARDGVVPRILGRGVGVHDEPRIATAAAFLIALAGVLAGDLNAIAPVLSMFFLTSYGVLNLSAGFESLIASPSWRPRFRVPAWLSLLGAFGCFATMFMINAGATFIAALLTATVFYLMQRRHMRAHWGDLRYGLLMLLARYSIYRLADSRPDEKTWRPSILVLSGSPSTRFYLIELADAITHGKGFLTVSTIVPKGIPEERIRRIKKSIREYLNKRGVPALVEVQEAEDAMAGSRALVRSFGIGPLVPNTILLGETEESESFAQFSELIQLAHRMERNLVVVREGAPPPALETGRRIDVWWGLQQSNAGLMMALAYMLQTSPEWRRSTLNLKTVVKSAEKVEYARQRLEEFLRMGRIEAVVKVLVSSNEDVFETIAESSQGCHLAFMGIRPPAPEEAASDYSSYYSNLLEKTESMPPTAFVMANENIDFHRIFQ